VDHEIASPSEIMAGARRRHDLDHQESEG